MKAGTIFEHPTKYGGVVRLKAVEKTEGMDALCSECIFGGNSEKCESLKIKRDRGITGSCSDNEVIYILAENIEPKLSRIMERIKYYTDSTEFDILESEISKILKE